MPRIFLIAALTIVTPVAAFAQENSKRITLTKAELELIALAREFVDTSIGKEIIVVRDGVTLIPSGLMRVAEVKGRWESVELEEIDAHIEGDKAVVTGRVKFNGHSPNGRPIAASSGVRIWYVRREGHWKYVTGCLGGCGTQ